MGLRAPFRDLFSCDIRVLYDFFRIWAPLREGAVTFYGALIQRATHMGGCENYGPFLV